MVPEMLPVEVWEKAGPAQPKTTKRTTIRTTGTVAL
jgi:hypothetical protein